jgi:hypothetical protein
MTAVQQTRIAPSFCAEAGVAAPRAGRTPPPSESDLPVLITTGSPDRFPTYWNPFARAFQTEEQLWAWCGNWDL